MPSFVSDHPVEGIICIHKLTLTFLKIEFFSVFDHPNLTLSKLCGTL